MKYNKCWEFIISPLEIFVLLDGVRGDRDTAGLEIMCWDMYTIAYTIEEVLSKAASTGQDKDYCEKEK